MLASDLYARKSSTDQGRSAARQESDWRRDCHREGLDPGRVFVDPDLSASRYATKDRPGYAELLAYLNSGQCRVLSLWEASRGARNMREWVELLDVCREHNILIRIFGGDSPDTFDQRKPRDRRALLQDGITAEGESEVLSSRVRDGIADAAQSGKPGGPTLYGYRHTRDEKGRLAGQEPHPEHARVVRRLVRDTLAGQSLNGQARNLTRQGVPAPGGAARWYPQTIRRVLLNPGLTGQRTHLGKVVAEAAWDPIVSAEDHQQLRGLLASDHAPAKGGPDLKYLLSHAMRCGLCGGPMTTSRRVRYVCRECTRTSCPISDADHLVTRLIQHRLAQPGADRLLAPKIDTQAAREAEREAADLRKHLKSFVDKAINRELDADSLADIQRGLRPQIEAAEQRARDAAVPSPLARYRGMNLAVKFPILPVAERRTFVRELAVVVLSPAGRPGTRWSPQRLAGSRWVSDDRTWGDLWQSGGVTVG